MDLVDKLGGVVLQVGLSRWAVAAAVSCLKCETATVSKERLVAAAGKGTQGWTGTFVSTTASLEENDGQKKEGKKRAWT